jgi:hypothetical protein
MAHNALCSRDDMALDASTVLDTAMEPPKERSKSGISLTRQQQEEFGTKRVSESDSERPVTFSTSEPMPLSASSP